MSLKRSIKNIGKAAIAKSFRIGQRLGFDVLPRHFYSEIPDLNQLQATTPWREPYSMIGIAGANDLEEQIAYVRALMANGVGERIASKDIFQSACDENGEAGYGPVEADCLYAFVASKKPARIVQVGCGVSTAICLAAARDGGFETEITCVEPYPNEFLKNAEAQGNIRLIPKPVQDLSYDFFDHLSEGDFFFIDSTHTLGPAGEVTRIICEMLPRLAPGVLVHFHDIWFPYDYSPSVLDQELFFWHETSMLMAFLSGNSSFRVCASMSLLHHFCLEELSSLFPRYTFMEFEKGVRVSPGAYPCSIFLVKQEQGSAAT